MARFTFTLLASVLAFSTAFVASAPVPSFKSLESRQAASFKEQSYASFQISDGVAGNALAESNAIFVDPFKNVNLATVDQATIVAIENMRVAAENQEVNVFNPAIAKASGTQADALQAGKIKNKVLKLVGISQKIEIQLAQAKAAGKSTSSLEASLADAKKKLATNVAIDVASAGKPSKAA